MGWRRVGDNYAGRATTCRERAARVLGAVRAGKSPSDAFVLRIISNGGGKILRLIDRERLRLR